MIATTTRTKKITVATVKSFIRKAKAAGTLLVRCDSSFDGMTDCVERNRDAAFFAPQDTRDHGNNLGLQGIYFVGQSRDWCKAFDDGEHVGFEVSNCCGSWVVATKKVASPAADKNAAISMMILAKVSEGMTLRQAFDAVIGEGRFDAMVSDLYDDLRKTA
jgi:hypothetical protein